MNDLAKIDMLKAQMTGNGDGRSTPRLERADLATVRPGQSLHSHIGNRLRNVFPAPQDHDGTFESLLKEISDRLP